MWLVMLPNRPFLYVFFCDTLYSVEYSTLLRLCKTILNVQEQLCENEPFVTVLWMCM